MSDPTKTKCIAAQLPLTMYAQLDELHQFFPGVSRQALIKVGIRLLIEAEEGQIQARLGRD